MRSGSILQPSMPPAMVVGQPVSAPCHSSHINAAPGLRFCWNFPHDGNTWVTLMRLMDVGDIHRASFWWNPVAHASGDHGEAPKTMAALWDGHPKSKWHSDLDDIRWLWLYLNYIFCIFLIISVYCIVFWILFMFVICVVLCILLNTNDSNHLSVYDVDSRRGLFRYVSMLRQIRGGETQLDLG